MLKRKRLAAAMMAAFMVFSAAACGQSAAGTADSKTSNESGTNESKIVDERTPVDDSRKTTANSGERYDKITVAIDSDPQDLLPYNYNAGSKPYIYHNFYECLFDLENGEYIPVMAKSYEDVDELHTRVEIYDYIYDSDGNHITADDVVFSYQVLLDSGYAVKYEVFDNIEKIDDYTVEFTWKEKPSSVAALEFPWCRTIIFSQKAYEEGNFATAPVGTGPYVVTNFVSGSNVTLEANDDYWQTDKSLISRRHQSNVQTIEYDIISEAAQHVIALQSGTIDYTEKLPTENLSEFEESGQYGEDYVVSVTQGSQLYAMFTNNTEGTPCSDENFRKAVFYAIDNEACAAATGTCVACKAIGSPHFSDYVDSWEDEATYVNTYEPELAKEYLEKSSYSGEKVILLAGNDEIFKNLATVIQSFLVNIGINAEISSVETVRIPDYATDNGSWDLYLYQLGGGSQVGEWSRMFNNKEYNNGMCTGFIADDKLQELYETANTVETHNDETMTAVHNYVIEKAYTNAIVTPSINTVCSSDIAEIYLREDEFLMPGACIYYLD